MKLVFYSVVLNHHQAPVADEFYKILGDEYCFVELINLGDNKGATEDYGKRPYLLRAWESQETHDKAMWLTRTAECCIFSGIDALPYEKERMRLGLLSFDMGERWLKHGYKSFASPRLLKWLWAYYTGGWKHKPIHKLCMSAFAASDHYKMGTFKNKAYKWGYFTSVARYENENENKVDSEILMQHLPSADCSAQADVLQSPSEITPLMWCSRFLMLKHPELPILMAERLKKKGYKFHLDLYGTGEYEESSKKLVESLKIMDVVTFHGAIPNDQVHKAMRRTEIFLFTSDQYEGWGAVANESLSEGCVLVASDAIGSSPYLIEEGVNGFKFHSSKTSCSFGNIDKVALNSLCEKVEWLLNHPTERKQMQQNAERQMQEIWSPANAATALLQLINDLQNHKDSSIIEGPCSKA